MRKSLGVLSLLVVGVLSLPLMINAEEFSVAYKEVQRAFLREKHETVVVVAEAFLEAVVDGPQAHRVRIWLAMSQDRLGNTAVALAQIDSVKRRLDAKSDLWPEVLFWEGDISQRGERPLRAKLVWTELSERFPKSTWAIQAHLGLGNMYLAQKGYRAALDHFHTVGAKDLERRVALEARLLEGLCLLRLNRFEEAMLGLKPLLSRFKDRVLAARAGFHLGEAFAGVGRHEEAIQAYERAIQAKRSSVWATHALFGVGWAEFQLGRCGKSLKTFALYGRRKTEERQLETWFARGSCLVQVDRRDEAVSWLQRVVREEPKHVLACESGLLLADVFREEGRLGEASRILEDLQQFSWETSLESHIALRLGKIRLEQGEISKASDQFKTALLAPELEVRLSALNGLGDLHMYLGEYASAQRRYAEVWEITRQVAPAGRLGADAGSYALYQQGRIHSLQGEASEAIEIFYRLIAQAQEDLADDARLALASTYILKQEGDRARRQLAAIRRRAPKSVSAARAAYYLALLTLSEGKVEVARRYCEQAVEGSPRSDEGIEARVLLAQLDAQDGADLRAARRLEYGLEVQGLAARQRGRLAKERGELARRSGACDTAVQWHEEAARLAPMLRGEADYRIGSCREVAGDLDQALTRYLKVSEGPWKVRAHLAAAKVMERQERWKDAEAIYEALAQESVPEAKVARELLASRRSEYGMRGER